MTENRPGYIYVGHSKSIRIKKSVWLVPKLCWSSRLAGFCLMAWLHWGGSSINGATSSSSLYTISTFLACLVQSNFLSLIMYVGFKVRPLSLWKVARIRAVANAIRAEDPREESHNQSESRIPGRSHTNPANQSPGSYLAVTASQIQQHLVSTLLGFHTLLSQVV